MNIKDYVKTDKNALDLDNEVDALVIAQSSYFPFEKAHHNLLFPIKLSEITVDTKKIPRNRMKKATQRLLGLMINSRKFSSLEIIDFAGDSDNEKEQQFSAITYLVNQKALFIAYRGTDSTAVGWKEDLNMSFSEQVSSQLSGVAYLNRILHEYDYPVYICGHSKGGNIAVYSAAFCDPSLQRKIIKVYNFDGPGFRSEVILKPEYIKILPRIVKFIPKASIIGKLMNTDEQEIIVDSNQVSIFQHDVFNWIIEDNQLKRVTEITGPARHFSKSLQKWLEEITYELA